MKHVRSGVLLAAAFLSAPYLARAAADQFAQSRVLSLLASLDDGGTTSVGTVAVDPARKRVIVRNLSSRNGGASVEVGTLNIPMEAGKHQALAALSLVTPVEAHPVHSIRVAQDDSTSILSRAASAAASDNGTTASADDITVKNGTTTYRIKHIELKGTSLSNADLTAIFDAKTADTVEARLRRLTAKSIVMSEIDIEWTANGSTEHWVQHDVALTDVVSGKVGTGTLGKGGLTVAPKDASSSAPSNAALETTSVDFANLDMPLAAHVAATPRGDSAETLAPVFDSIVLHGLTIADPDNKGSLRLGTVKFSGGRARATKDGLLNTLTEIGQAKSGDPQLRTAAADLVGSVALGSGELDDLRTTSAQAAGQPAGTTGSIKTLRFEGLGDDKLAKAHLDGLAVDDKGTAVRLATMDVGGVKFGLLPAEGDAKAKRPSPLVTTMSIEGLQVDKVGETDKPDDATARTTVHMKVARADYTSDASAPGTVPPNVNLKIEHVTFDLPADDESFKALTTLGYTQLDLSGASKTVYDGEKQTLTFDPLRFAGADMGSISVKLDLANVSNGIASSNAEVQKASALAMLLKGVTIDIRNDGLFERAIKSKAAMDGTTVAEEKEKGINLATLMLPALMNDNPKLKVLGNAIADFIRNPKTLHIAITPKRGLGMLDAATAANDPNALLDVIDIEASADH